MSEYNMPEGTHDCQHETGRIGDAPNSESFTPAEIDAVRELNDWLDDPQGSMPDEFDREVNMLLSVAWYVTEEFIRHETGKCSSTHTRKDEHVPETEAPFTCHCCRYYHQISGCARHLRGFIR